MSLLLTAIALLLWSHSIVSARFEIGYFGLIHGLPVSFFLALAVLTTASGVLWASREASNRLMALQLLILLSALWLIPIITGGSATYADHAYRNLGIADYIAQEGHFSLDSYFQWPGVFIITAVLGIVSTVNLEPILDAIPFIMQLLCLPFLYIFLRNTLGNHRSNLCWAGAWLFFLARWVGDSHLTPISLGCFLTLVLLALVTTPLENRTSSQKFALWSLAIITFATLTITHLPTSIAALAIIGLFSLAKRDRILVSATVVCCLLLLGWDFLGSGYMMDKLGVVTPGSLGSVNAFSGTGTVSVDAGATFDREAISFFSGSESHTTMSKFKLGYSAMFAMIGLIGAIFACRTKARLVRAIPLLAISVAPLSMFIFSGNYDSLLGTRIYLYCLPGMAFFGASLLDTRKKGAVAILCIFLIIAAPLHVISLYGNQAQEYVPPGQVAGVHFFRETTSLDLGELSVFPMSRRYTHERLELMEQVDNYSPRYIWLTHQDSPWYDAVLNNQRLLDEHRQSLSSNPNHGLVYVNPDFTLYTRQARMPEAADQETQ